jgi:hypothetical protein
VNIYAELRMQQQKSAADRAFLAAGTLILLLAAALRLPALGQVPPGLYHDEAYYGLDAVDVLRGHLQVYFPANNGREPLFIYLAAGMIGLLGRSPFALRLTSAFVGLLTVAATAAAGRALFSRRVGLLAAAVLSVTLWHVHLSRVGFRAVTLPLTIALTLWVGARAVRTGRPRLWLAAGALYGLSFYTYTAARFTPVALGVWGAYLALTSTPRPPSPSPAWRERGRGKPPETAGGVLASPPASSPLLTRGQERGGGGGEAAGGGVRPLALALLAAAIVLTPLAIYTAIHPDVVLGRPDQVSIWNPAINGGDPWGTLGRHFLRTLGMFFVRGDRIWRHNVPWRPVFGPLLGAAFLLGVGVALTSSPLPPSPSPVGRERGRGKPPEAAEDVLTPPPASSPLLTRGQERGGGGGEAAGGGVRKALTPSPLPPSPSSTCGRGGGGTGVGVRARALPLLWTAVMALPTVLAEDAPHFLRAVGMLPVLAFLPALGLDALMQNPPQRHEDTKKKFSHVVSLCLRGSPIGVGVSILAIGLELVSGARAYFGPYARNPTTGYWFERGAVALGADINRFLGVGWSGEASPLTPTAGPDGVVYLDPLLWEDWPQVRFLVTAPDRVQVGLEARSEPRSEAEWRPTAVFLWPYGDWTRAWALLPHPAAITVLEGPLSQHDRDTGPFTTYLAFLATRPGPAAPPQARLQGGVEFLGATVIPQEDGAVRVRLRWRATAPLAGEYAVFLHYRRDGQTVGQGDSPPAGGRYPTPLWQPGDVLNDDHIVPGVGRPQPGRDELVFGLWNPQTGEYLSVLDEAGNPAGVEIRVAIEGVVDESSDRGR